ncbi:MAG: O-antigen ligase family protein [Actinomycetota bacterium]|nr:O-antigen ligase family protein [Actinomycetota bacterium]
MGTFGLVLAYALRGGSYDIVVFEEYGLLIWWLLAVGIAVGVLPRVRPARVVMLMWAAMLAYAAWTAISLVWTQSSELTTEEIARSLDYLGLLLLLGLILGKDTWRAAAAGLAFGAFAVCAMAVASRLAPGAFPADAVLSTLKIDRLSYPFGYWNAVAAWGAMSITIALAWSAHDRLVIRRAAIFAFVPVAALATYLSYSRAGVIGTAFGIVLVILASSNRLTVAIHACVAAAGAALLIVTLRRAPQIAHATGDRRALTVLLVLVLAIVVCAAAAWLTGIAGVDGWRLPRRPTRVVLAACSVAALVAAVIVGPSVTRKAWHSFSHPVTVGATATGDPAARLLSLSGVRYDVWKSALAAFETHALDGTGAGTFEFWFNRHPERDPQFVRDAHNLWLENMAELGLPGLLLILAIVITATAAAVSARRRSRLTMSVGLSTGFAAAFLVFLFHASVDWMWESTAITVLALAGVSVLGARLAGGQWRLSWWARSTFVVIALGAGALQLPGLLSTNEIRRSQAAEHAGNGNRALALANDAIAAEPWSASAYEQRGLVLEAAGRYSAAAAALRRAISYEPINYVHRLDLARIETERGQVEAALRDYSRAQELRPNSTAFPVSPGVKLR